MKLFYLHAEAGIRIDIRQGEKIRGPHKEVTMERVQGHSSRAPINRTVCYSEMHF
jgi:hypothetical protein